MISYHQTIALLCPFLFLRLAFPLWFLESTQQICLVRSTNPTKRFIDQEIVPAFAREERWQDKNWVLQETKKLAQDRQKIVLVKRYTEQERERLIVLKKRLETTQLQYDKLQFECGMSSALPRLDWLFLVVFL